MISFKSGIKILAFSLVLSLLVRFGSVAYTNHSQDNSAKEVCSLVAMSLQTNSLRAAYEGMQSALSKTTLTNSCVSIVDSGRSYSPMCIKDNLSYRTTHCKVEGNTGVLASISFEEENFFNLDFVILLITVVAGILILITLLGSLARVIIFELSNEVKGLLESAAHTKSTNSRAQQFIRFLLLKTGIHSLLQSKSLDIKKDFQAYESQIKSEAIKKVRLEEDQLRNQDYVEKVKQIRHDIRSPLSSIQSAYELLNKNEKASQSIATAIRRIQILIDDLNEVDKVHEKSKLLIAEITLAETVLILSSKFESQKNANLTFEFDNSSLTPISAREKDFTSVIENLLENSLDAIGMNGQVVLKIEKQQRNCIITVEDNGCGVAVENISNLFLKGATFGKANGIGLGLFHAKKTIESFGGTISYVAGGHGARFEIRLPVIQTGVVFTGLPNDLTIKVIDDDSLVPKSLAGAGYTIAEHAQTFEAGKTLFENSRSDSEVILVDNQLGRGKFGTELIGQQLRRKNIYLCTNDYDDLDLINQARSIGVKVLPKPLIFLSLAKNL